MCKGCVSRTGVSLGRQLKEGVKQERDNRVIESEAKGAVSE